MAHERFQLHAVGSVQVIALTLPASVVSEEFDTLNVALAQTMSAVPAGPGRRWVIDLSAVAYSGSALLGMLVNLRSRARLLDGRLVFCALHPRLLDVLRASSMERLFVLTTDRDEAVRRVTEG